MERTRFDSRQARKTRAEKDFNKDGAKTKGNQQDMVQPRFDPDRFPFCSGTFLHKISETRYHNSLTTERKGELKSSELNSSKKKTNVSFKKSLKSSCFPSRYKQNACARTHTQTITLRKTKTNQEHGKMRRNEKLSLLFSLPILPSNTFRQANRKKAERKHTKIHQNKKQKKKKTITTTN
jgi:hypothetical protein